ncbi:MAG TPA: prepilin-type N-terminal cleavage/methylation domain-containing protein, partial [Thermoanaerobaculia bacterium]
MQSSAVRNARNSERGMTLAETLVAVAIFAIVFIAALTLYTAANRAYLATDSATIQQQNTRFAMDRMMETLRDAGANYNTLGSASLPDEQVEGAWQSAIFVRGDYDNHRERTAEGAPTTLEASDNVHDIVTTGNDEIVGYVLRKPVGATDPNTITLTIKADFSAPRDATLSGTTIANEESKTVKVAATDLPGQTSPPYQLVRVTFDASGTAQYDVIAENVFRLSFTYYNSSNATITTPPGSDDGTSNADRTTRGTIRKFDVNLIGMSDRPDSQYTDTTVYSPAEGTATKHYRKFSLSEHILAPNLGVKGKKHQFAPSTSITAPASLTVCTGHCYYFHLSWPASSTSNVTTYKIHVTAAAGSTAAAVDQYITVDDLEYNYKQPDTELRAFNFQVAGTGVGGDGAYTSTATATSSNAAQSIPSAPANVNAEQEVHIDALALEVTWEPVTTNTQALNTALCTTVGSGAGSTVPTATWNTDAPDIDHYEVYRVRS